MFRRNVVEKIKTHFILMNFFLFVSENLAVCEIMWENIVEPYRLQETM